MNGYNKEEVKRDMCKSHTARSDREFYRVCPSKLSKKELEDLYFTLLEKNLELKKTVTSQQDQIKVLSTKVQRMTVMQKSNVAKEKECCVYTKTLVNEQKESIADLKKANERLGERIRVLNMRLCSAKQFLRRSPATSTSRCNKCYAPPTSLKNSSVSVLHPKTSDSNIKAAASGPDKDVMLSTRTVETETDEPEKENTERICNENRCRSLMEELKHKIVDLQEELSKTHAEYSTRITRLESEVSDLRSANDRERTERAASDHQVQMRDQQADQLAARLRDAEAKYGELSTELSIEKRKVTELETRVKAADRAAAVAGTIQQHLDATNKIADDIPQSEPATTPFASPRADKLELPCGCYSPGQPSESTDKPSPDKDVSTEKQPWLSKLSTDSGYIEAYKSPKTSEDNKEGKTDFNEELQNRIAHLQQQINQLLSAMKTSTLTNERTTSKGSDGRSVYSEACSDIPRSAGSPAINIVPASDSYVGKTLESASLLKMPENINAKPPDNMMTFLDESNVDQQKMAEREDIQKLYESTNTSPTLDKTVKTEATNIDVVIDNDEKESLVTKEVTPERSDLPKISNAPTKKYVHNKIQIPGPLPVDNPFKVPDNLIDQFKKTTTIKYSKHNKEPVKGRETEKSEGISVKKDGLHEIPLRFKDEICEKSTVYKVHVDNDVKFENDVKVSTKDDTEAGPSKAPGPMVSLTEKYIENEAPSSSTIIPTMSSPPDNAQDKDVELCLHHTRVCTCGGGVRRDVRVFRSCSGTLRFRTAPAAGTFKRCSCTCGDNSGDVDERCDQATQSAPAPPSPAVEFRQRSGTYTKEEARPGPPRSPENTDNEISSLTDLPSEKDGKSPREPLSLGEEKPTTTYTDSYTPHTTTEYSTLSEGECPGAGGGAQKLSEGETKDCPENQQFTLDKTASMRMEQALSAITEELALCRDLLRARSDDQSKRLTKDACQSVDLNPGPIALKRAAGSPRIGDAFTPKCVFTLHVGTVVLSDEAVINSRDMSLVLTWKFFDQSVTMTRMRAGRVMLFDFSTEYDVKITDHFLDYLRHENMQIIISEIDKQDEPFASCALPLRDALLHTNRRADMSLALVAGPNRLQTHDALDSGDEVGVLDLWCMLKVDPTLLPAINRAIAKSSPINLTPTKEPPRMSACMAQLIEEDRKDEANATQNIDEAPLTLEFEPVLPKNPNSRRRTLYDFDVPESTTSKQRSEFYDLSFDVGARQQVPRYHEGKGHAVREARRSIASQVSGIPGTQQVHQNIPRRSLQRSQVGFVDPDIRSNLSKIIANEVPAQIKSPNDMKQALDRNAAHEQPITQLGKEDEAASQTHSTASYWRGLVTRRLIPKSAQRSSFCKTECSSTSLRKKDRGKNMPSSRGTPPAATDVEEPPELSRSIRDNSKKSVTIAKYNKKWNKEKALKENQNVSEIEVVTEDSHVSQTVEITVMWLALNEECDAMVNPNVQRLYVAYSFLGRSGADMETPLSLPKPKSYVDKCFFHFTKQFQLSDCDLPLLGHMARCRSTNRKEHSPRDCAVFTVVSEPPEDPLGLDNCEDIGYAYLYFGDLLAYSAGNDSYIEVVPVQSAQPGETVCGVLAVKVEGLDVLRRCMLLAASQRDVRLTVS